MDSLMKRKDFQDLMTNVSKICDEIMVIYGSYTKSGTNVP